MYSNSFIGANPLHDLHFYRLTDMLFDDNETALAQMPENLSHLRRVGTRLVGIGIVLAKDSHTDFLTGLFNRMCCEKDLAKYVDDPAVTPTNRVIVVSRKFMSLRNKAQLILLERHNRLEDDVVISCNQDRNSRANVMTISQYGAFRCKRAFAIETRIRERSEMKMGKKLGKATKKHYRQMKRGNASTEKEPDISDLLHPKTGAKEPLNEEKPQDTAKHEGSECYA